MSQETRNERRRREKDSAKAARRKAKAAEIAARRLRIVDGGGEPEAGAEVRASGKGASQQQLIDAVDTTYQVVVAFQCAGCGVTRGNIDDKAVASGFNRATFLMKCSCGKVLRMKPAKKHMGSDRNMQAKAIEIAKAKQENRPLLFGPDGRPV